MLLFIWILMKTISLHQIFFHKTVYFIILGDRAHNIEILAGYSDSNLVPVYYNSGILGPIETFYFPNNTDAQIIMVRINDLIPEILHLCEVEIYGVYKRPGNLHIEAFSISKIKL
jgi:hypothetical protein